MPKPSDLPYRPCVGLMILGPGGGVFAGNRIDTPGPAWQMPQGGVDKGETPEEAALRELHEETGLSPHHIELVRETADWVLYDLPEDKIGVLLGGKYRGQKQKWFACRLTAPESAINIATEEPEFDAWRWMTPAALTEGIVPFKRHVYEAVFAEFGELL